jgi:hypothetical protein
VKPEMQGFGSVPVNEALKEQCVDELADEVVDKAGGKRAKERKKKSDGVADKNGRLNWGLLLPAKGQILGWSADCSLESEKRMRNKRWGRGMGGDLRWVNLLG